MTVVSIATTEMRLTQKQRLSETGALFLYGLKSFASFTSVTTSI